MLQISTGSFAALERYSLPGFIARLTNELIEEFPDQLGLYPEELRQKIVENMVARAQKRWKLKSQEALTSYCEFMLAVAANFDDDPDIQAALASNPEDPDGPILEIGILVTEPTWTRVQARAARLPLYVPVEALEAPVTKRVEKAAQLLLADRIPANAVSAAASRAVVISEKLGLSDDPDAGLVILACQAVWGRSLFDTEFPDWATHVLSENCPPQRKVKHIRAAVADAAGLII